MNVSRSANSFGESGTSVPRARRAATRVEPQVADDELRRPLDAAPPRQRPQPREELRERERLRQVVVGPGVEPGDPVADRVPRGQHQHGRPDTGLAQLAARLEAVAPGEHDVEHDRVVRVRLRHPQRVLTGNGDVGDVSLFGQAAPDETRHLQLVLDDQHPHRDPSHYESQMSER